VESTGFGIYGMGVQAGSPKMDSFSPIGLFPLLATGNWGTITSSWGSTYWLAVTFWHGISANPCASLIPLGSVPSRTSSMELSAWTKLIV